MAQEITIAISARDNFTQAVTTMRNANNSFTRDLAGLESRLNALNRTRTTLTIDTRRLRADLRDAQRAFDQTGGAEERLRLETAQLNFENAQRNLRLVSQEARRAERDLRNFGDEQNRQSNRAGGGGGRGGISGAMSSLGQAGFFKMFGDAASQAANTFVGSAFGSEAGTMFSSMLSSVGAGAAMGTMVGGPVGTALGAAGGLVVGAINGASQVYSQEDDAFKSVVQERYNTVTQEQTSDLQAGSQIAAGRETSLVSFTTLFGDKGVAEKYLEDMKEMANTTPFLYDDLAQMSKTLKTFGYSTEEMIPQLTAVGDTGAALGMSTSDMSMTATAIGRMKSSGKTSLEYLNILMERGIPAVKYLSEELGVSQGDIYAKVSKGQINGEEAAKIISDAMAKYFGGAMAEQSKTFSGKSSTLEGMNQEMQNAMGEGYNETRMMGMDEQIEFLSGEGGEKMQEANRLIGEYKASLENLQEQYQRDALTTIMEGGPASDIFSESAVNQLKELGAKYQSAIASENGAEAGRILAEAKVLAQAEYDASEGAQTELASQKALIGQVRDTLVKDRDYWSAGYDLGQEFTKGMAAGLRAMAGDLKPENVIGPYATEITANDVKWSETSGGANIADAVVAGPYGDTVPAVSSPGISQTLESAKSKAVANNLSGLFGHAAGLRRVPRDDYVARLHEGERVLTAAEAREYNSMEFKFFTMNDINNSFDTSANADKILIKPYNSIFQKNANEENTTRFSFPAPAKKETDNVNGTNKIDINIAEMVVREDTDIDRIATQLYEKIRRAQQIS